MANPDVFSWLHETRQHFFPHSSINDSCFIPSIPQIWWRASRGPEGETCTPVSHFLRDSGQSLSGKDQHRGGTFSWLWEKLWAKDYIHKAIQPQGWKRIKISQSLIRVEDFLSGNHVRDWASKAITKEAIPSPVGQASENTRGRAGFWGFFLFVCFCFFSHNPAFTAFARVFS